MNSDILYTSQYYLTFKSKINKLWVFFVDSACPRGYSRKKGVACEGKSRKKKHKIK